MPLGSKHIGDIVVYTIPKVIGYAATIFVLPILTRLLLPEDFGIVAFTAIFPTIAVSVVTLGALNSQERYYFLYRNDPEKLYAYYFSTQLFALIIGALSSLLVYIFQKNISIMMMGRIEYGFAFFVGYIASFLGQMIAFYLLSYQYMGRSTIYALISIAQALLTSLFSVLFVWKFHMSYMGLIYGSLGASSLVLVSVAVIFNWNHHPQWSWKTLQAGICYGLQTVPKTFSGFINRFFDKYLLNNMVSLSAVGGYNIGQNVGNTLATLMSSVGSSFNHLYYQDVFDRGNAASESTGRLFSIFSFLNLAPVVLLIIFAQEIVWLLAPPAYYKAIDLIIVFSAALGPFIFGKYIGVQYAYANKAYLLFPITALAAVANVAANIILIPRYGLMGAAFSTYCSAWASNIVMAAVGQRLYRIAYDWPTIILFEVHIIISMVSILVLRSFAVSLVVLYAVKFFLLALFICIGIRAGIVSRKNIQKFITAVRPQGRNSVLTQ